MLRQSVETVSYAGAVRGAVARAYEVLREREADAQRELICRHIDELLDTTVVRWVDLATGRWAPPGSAELLPPSALAMEQALFPRALARERSLLSAHPMLDHDLRDLARRCAADQATVHVVLVRAHVETHGVHAMHWVNRPRPEYDRRLAFYYYWDIAGLAVAATQERQRVEFEIADLRRTAFTDELTGLPNALALEDQLRRHHATNPFAVAVLDFDGLRDANTVLGWERGGDALIRAVGRALDALQGRREFAARLHTAGDEFVVLLPHLNEHEATLRGAEIEKRLDAIPLDSHLQAVYHGASVGVACRQTDETPGHTLGRAIEAMRERKRIRSRRPPG